MEDMTKEQKEFFEREEKRQELLFEEPNYSKYKICYITDSNKADISISKHHIIFDYLAIGYACLAKEIKGDKEHVIYVAHKHYPNMEWVKIQDKIFPPECGGKSIPSNALIEITEDITKILERYYKNPEYPNMLAGIMLYTSVTSAEMGYTEKVDILDFENFDDTISAQKLAFKTIKKLVISNWLGSLQCYLLGYDD